MPLRTHALILAAGQSRRFGGSKLHALYQGRDHGFRDLLSSSVTETLTLDVKGQNLDVDTRADLDELEGRSR